MNKHKVRWDFERLCPERPTAGIKRTKKEAGQGLESEKRGSQRRWISAQFLTYPKFGPFCDQVISSSVLVGGQMSLCSGVKVCQMKTEHFSFHKLNVFHLVSCRQQIFNGALKDSAVRSRWWRAADGCQPWEGLCTASTRMVWFLQENNFTVPLPPRLDGGEMFFCSSRGALRGFLTMSLYWFFCSCHQIVCGSIRDYCFLICSRRFRSY